jgi:2-dehydro-3-deoxygluconokinase
MNQKQFAAIGECMLELSHENSTHLTLGFAGDTYNVATYVARLTHAQGLQTHYVTALGDDPYSEAMIARFQEEQIGTDYIQRLPGKLPGLYFIHLDEKGERSFYYYRSQSAARELFNDNSVDFSGLEKIDMLYFSGITLAILDDPSRLRFYDILSAAKLAGVIIAYDSNYRPRLWPDKAKAQAVFNHFLSLVDIALPTYDDEQLLCGDLTPQDTANRLRALGVSEVVVKSGPGGCLCSTVSGDFNVPTIPKQAVDTTAAGDSFNAAYLAARLQNKSVEEAAKAGHALAGEVIMHKGAIIPKEFMNA